MDQTFKPTQTQLDTAALLPRGKTITFLPPEVPALQVTTVIYCIHCDANTCHGAMFTLDQKVI